MPELRINLDLSPPILCPFPYLVQKCPIIQGLTEQTPQNKHLNPEPLDHALKRISRKTRKSKNLGKWNKITSEKVQTAEAGMKEA
jgi:hypothetical protein